MHCTAVVTCAFALLLLHATSTKSDTTGAEFAVSSLERTAGRTGAVPITEGAARDFLAVVFAKENPDEARILPLWSAYEARRGDLW